MTQADRGIQSVLAELGIPEALPVLSMRWEESGASFREEGAGSLDPEEVAERAAFARLPAEVIPPLLETARRVRERDALARLAWHCARLLFLHREVPRSAIEKWPALTGALGDLAGLFYLLVALEMVPILKRLHQELGVAEEVTRDTCSAYLELLASYDNANDGRGLGAYVPTLPWLRHYSTGELFCLGRLEFMIRPFGKWVHVFRHRETGEVLALAADGTRFNAEGTIDSDREPVGGWTARLRLDEEKAVGCPISPLGFGERREAALDLQEWRLALKPGDPVLDTHIPFGGGMTPERCGESMRRALKFFPRVFPDRPFAGFACTSWVLNPHLERIYRPDANMVRWQRELYLFPIPSGGSEGLFFMFGKEKVDPAAAPRDTSIRRALLDHVAAGGRLIAGGMFFLAEDFPRYGSQCYRSPSA